MKPPTPKNLDLLQRLRPVKILRKSSIVQVENEA